MTANAIAETVKNLGVKMETLEQVIAEKNRLAALEKEMKAEMNLKAFKEMNIVRNEAGKVISHDAYTWTSQEYDVVKFEKDDSRLLSHFSSPREYVGARVRITFLDNL